MSVPAPAWENLRVFAAACAHGSFSAAAGALGMGQATVSRRIATLEDTLDAVLFDRTRDGLVLTAAGRALLPHAEAMLAAAHAARDTMAGFESDVSGVVRVAMPPGPAVDLGPPLAHRVQARYPGITLEILAANRVLDLAQREADIAVRAVAPTGAQVVARRFPAVRAGVFMSAALAASLGPAPRAADVPWLQYTQDLQHMPIARWVNAQLGTRTAAMRSNSFLVLRAAACRGMGAVTLPIVQGELLGLTRVPALEDGLEAHAMPWYLVTLAALRSVPRVRAVADELWAIGSAPALAATLRAELDSSTSSVDESRLRQVPLMHSGSGSAP